MSKEFVHFLLADPIVLVVVEYRDQHVQVRQKLMQWNRVGQLDGEVGAFAPIGEVLVQRVPRRGDGVAKWLEQSAQQSFAAAAGQDTDPRGQRDRHGGKLRPLAT